VICNEDTDGRARVTTDDERYATIEEFNVDSKAKCDQFNLAHVARKKYNKKAMLSQGNRAMPL